MKILSIQVIIERAVCVTRLIDRKTVTYLIMPLNEALNQLAKAYCMDWYGHVFRREDARSYCEKGSDSQIDSQRWKTGFVMT